MKPITEFTKDQFAKFAPTPVKLKPFDPRNRLIAKEYIRDLDRTLAEWNIQAKIMGSTAYGIAGKGAIEVGLFLHGYNWEPVLGKLEEVYGQMEVKDRDYAQFHDEFQNYDIKVMLFKGHAAKVNRKLHDFFLNHPQVVKQYEDLKKRFSYSRRDYQREKQEFLNDIIEDLPEEEIPTEDTNT
jgi:GrpB-like predicted nucleotidyltransferase (UPF0157 family)